MSGTLRVVREVSADRAAGSAAGDDPHDHVVFHMSSGNAVVFNDPRRFGVMDLIRPGGLRAIRY
jgi:formamidopyrimidine-DNA glycosylase